MRKLYFLLPGTTGKFGGGGLWAELKTIKLAQQVCQAEIVTYRQKEANKLFLKDLLNSVNYNDCIFVVSWGFDVPQLIKKLGNYHLIYHAHSANYKFRLPSNIPIITVSRNTMGYWGEKAANSLIYYLPNQLGTEFYDRQQTRDIDVLVQTRKSSEYLTKQLIPTLQTRCKVEVIHNYVEDLAALFNRSKVYLYDSAEYWASNGVTEGFGLPPLEALACGCYLFSSVNHALADYLDPGFNCSKIACYSVNYDCDRIINIVNSSKKVELPASFWETYQAENLLIRLQHILQEINAFFDRANDQENLINPINDWQIKKVKTKSLITKIIKKIKK